MVLCFTGVMIVTSLQRTAGFEKPTLGHLTRLLSNLIRGRLVVLHPRLRGARRVHNFLQ